MPKGIHLRDFVCKHHCPDLKLKCSKLNNGNCTALDSVSVIKVDKG